jgi:hypothetical protein
MQNNNDQPTVQLKSEMEFSTRHKQQFAANRDAYSLRMLLLLTNARDRRSAPRFLTREKRSSIKEKMGKKLNLKHYFKQ